MSEDSKMKECPFCAEDVKIEAKKCRHCGETLDVALRAAEEAKNDKQNVFMNAGGGGASSSSSSSSGAGSGFLSGLGGIFGVVCGCLLMILFIPCCIMVVAN